MGNINQIENDRHYIVLLPVHAYAELDQR